MGSQKLKLGPKAHLPFKVGNKQRRQALGLKRKRALDSLRRDERFKRKREEDKNPRLRENRLAHNIPATLDRKRIWDDVAGDEEDALGLAVDVERLKRRRTEEEADEANVAEAEHEDETHSVQEEVGDDADSMLDEDEGNEDEKADDVEVDRHTKRRKDEERRPRSTSPPVSTASTRLDLTPEALMVKFPTLFEPPKEPKVLVTTSINSTLHDQAHLLTTLFPNSTYIRRSAHRFSHKFSVREIAKFSANRGYTTLVVMMEDQKKPCGLDVVHLPEGPHFHFSISNWVEGKKLPGHGNPTNHYPELILNNFRTPLGLLTAHLFRGIFPPQPEFEGRQVLTFHNQRDYIFVRRHRYVFRDRREREKQIVDASGKPMKGAEEIRTGLQELGPRFTLKLRRIDRGIQRRSGQEWEWKAGSEKQRTRFQL